MATNTEDRLIGTLFHGRYRVERKLGSGGMADVYLAEDEELGRKVALKVLNERHANDEQFVERFKREARNAAGLNHPHIVRVYDRGEVNGTYYIAMEYLDGPTLKELLVRGVAVVEDLDRDPAPELLVLGQVDVGHPPAAEPAQDAVPPVEERVDQRVRGGHEPRSVSSTPSARVPAIRPWQ